jgi:hypothetical protein
MDVFCDVQSWVSAAQLYGDNVGTITLTKNTKHNTRVKHIDIRHHYIREHVDNGDIVVHHIPTSDNLADMFMKTLGTVDFLILHSIWTSHAAMHY